MTAQNGKRLPRGGLALFAIRQQHRVPFVAHDAAIVERTDCDSPCQPDGFPGRVGATTMHSGVYLDDYIDGVTGAHTTTLEFLDVEFALHRRDRANPRGDGKEAIDLGGTRDLVGYENWPQSGPGQHIGLAKLGRGYPNRAGSKLAAGDLGCLGRLEMGPQLLRTTAEIGPHYGYVVLDEVEVENQCGRVDIGLAHNAALWVRGASVARAPGR